jgi:hypothetical protein
MSAATGSFNGTANGADFVPNRAANETARQFNVSVWGTFVGTVVLERSFDSGANYIPVLRYCTNTAVSYTAPSSEVLPEPEGGVIHRLRCSAYTSGTINWRLSA